MLVPTRPAMPPKAVPLTYSPMDRPSPRGSISSARIALAIREGDARMMVRNFMALDPT